MGEIPHPFLKGNVMHELSIVTYVIEQVEKIAKENELMMGSHILHDDYGYPVLSIDRPYNIGTTNGQLRTRVQAFVESVEIKKINGGVK